MCKWWWVVGGMDASYVVSCWLVVLFPDPEMVLGKYELRRYSYPRTARVNWYASFGTKSCVKERGIGHLSPHAGKGFSLLTEKIEEMANLEEFRGLSLLVFFIVFREKKIHLVMVSLRRQSVCGQPASWKIHSKPHRGIQWSLFSENIYGELWCVAIEFDAILF